MGCGASRVGLALAMVAIAACSGGRGGTSATTSGSGSTSTSGTGGGTIGGFISIPPMHQARDLASATRLFSEVVLVAGGEANGKFLASAEIYDPLAGNWIDAAAMSTGRDAHTATALGNRDVLVVG